MAIELFALAIALALIFDMINGFHDSANAIATVVATRVLTPLQAVLMAGFFNFVGPFIFSLAVANTVGKGIIDAKIVTDELVFGALIGAIVWDLITWWLGLPTSSSHALVGGLVGAAIAQVGLGSVLWPTSAEFSAVGLLLVKGALGGLLVGVLMLGWSRLRLPRFLFPLFALAVAAALGYYSYTHTDYHKDIVKGVMVSGVFTLFGAIMGGFLWCASQQKMAAKTIPILMVPGATGTLAVATLLGLIKLGGLTKTVIFMVVSPVLGFFMAFVLSSVIQWSWRNKSPGAIDTWSRRMQLGSSAFYALTHGTNDAQKTMGIIGVLLFAHGVIGETGGSLDIPAWVILASALAMGLGTAFGGWKIVKTMASRITHLTPQQGFAAETGGGVVLVAMAESGIPVSTTHAISSSIMGVGATKRASAVRWGVSRQMFIAWILTIPASAIVAAISYYLLVGVLRLAA
jgi:inorganic phosphate transporter, PiT family